MDSLILKSVNDYQSSLSFALDQTRIHNDACNQNQRVADENYSCEKENLVIDVRLIEKHVAGAKCEQNAMKIELQKCYSEIEREALVGQRDCVAELIVQYQSRFDVFHVFVDQTDAILECNQHNNVQRGVAQRAYVDDIEIEISSLNFFLNSVKSPSKIIRLAEIMRSETKRYPMETRIDRSLSLE